MSEGDYPFGLRKREDGKYERWLDIALSPIGRNPDGWLVRDSTEAQMPNSEEVVANFVKTAITEYEPGWTKGRRKPTSEEYEEGLPADAPLIRDLELLSTDETFINESIPPLVELLDEIGALPVTEMPVWFEHPSGKAEEIPAIDIQPVPKELFRAIAKETVKTILNQIDWDAILQAAKEGAGGAWRDPAVHEKVLEWFLGIEEKFLKRRGKELRPYQTPEEGIPEAEESRGVFDDLLRAESAGQTNLKKLVAAGNFGEGTEKNPIDYTELGQYIGKIMFQRTRSIAKQKAIDVSRSKAYKQRQQQMPFLVGEKGGILFEPAYEDPDQPSHLLDSFRAMLKASSSPSRQKLYQLGKQIGLWTDYEGIRPSKLGGISTEYLIKELKKFKDAQDEEIPELVWLAYTVLGLQGFDPRLEQRGRAGMAAEIREKLTPLFDESDISKGKIKPAALKKEMELFQSSIRPFWEGEKVGSKSVVKQFLNRCV